MTDLRISQLPELEYGDLQDSDYIPVVDISAGVTKKIRSDSFWMPVTDTVTEQAQISTAAAQIAQDEAVIAIANSADAQAARVAAEAARDAAQLSAGVYATTAAGLAATTTGRYFSVPSSDSAEYLILYLNNAGTAEEIDSYPSASKVSRVETYAIQTNSKLFSMARYIGSGDAIPLMTDSNGKILVGVDRATGNLIASGVANESLVQQYIRQLLNDFGSREYKGSGPVYPLLTDNGGRVLIGYDTEKNSMIGVSTSAVQRAVLETLAAPPVSRDINHLLFYGQSLSVGATGQPALSTTQPYSNLTFAAGPKSTKAGGTGWNPGLDALKPLVEDDLMGDYETTSSRGETCCSGAANYAIELRAIESGQSPSSHVILSSTAGHGGYSVYQLRKANNDFTHDSNNAITSPTNWYGVLLDQINAGKTLADAQSKTYGVPMVAWVQGEANRSTAMQTYINDLIGLRAEIEADVHSITGRTDPLYMATYQTAYGAGLADTQVHLAQLEATVQDSRILMVGPIFHMPSSDGTHLTNVGYKWLGHYFGRVYKQIMDGKRPKWIKPLSATASGTNLRVKFDVPVLPLQIDTKNLPNTTDKGFKVVDDTGTLTLSGISIESGDTVVITLNRALGANPVVRYAIDYLGTGCQFTNGASGNVRDSEPATCVISGVTRPLFNLAPHFKLNVIKLA